MEEKYWDTLFSDIKICLEKANIALPSVSLIALKYNKNAFCILLATIISLRTKDKITLESSIRLFSLGTSAEKIATLNPKTIEKAIYPCAFYKKKTQTIINISKILIEKYNSTVPNISKELLQLPGVGIKTANLTLNLAFDIEAICVDCHVHQIANRIGWIKTQTPEESEKALQKIMPKKYWICLNEMLVSFGQYICTPINPKCNICPIDNKCKKINVKTKNQAF